ARPCRAGPSPAPPPPAPPHGQNHRRAWPAWRGPAGVSNTGGGLAVPHPPSPTSPGGCPHAPHRRTQPIGRFRGRWRDLRGWGRPRVVAPPPTAHRVAPALPAFAPRKRV